MRGWIETYGSENQCDHVGLSAPQPSDPVSGGAVHLFPDIFGLVAYHSG